MKQWDLVAGRVLLSVTSLAALGASTSLVVACGGGSSSSNPGADAGPAETSAADVAQPKADGSTARDTGANDGTTGVSDVGTLDSQAPFETGAPIPGDGGPNCGNGVIDGTEECDDGNFFDLDGCDRSCRYEAITRMTALTISGSAGPGFCIHKGNLLGTGLISAPALGQLNPPLQTNITEGKLNVFTQFLGLGDLSGVSATGFQLGVLNGTFDPAKGAWPTSGNPIDWSFLVSPSTVSEGAPTGILTGGTITNGALAAGPSTVNLPLVISGTVALMTLRDATIAATIDSTPAPDVPAPPPAKLATGLTVFQTITATGTDQGLCGAITVDSLAQIPVPSALTTGTTKCSQGYTACGTSGLGPGCNSLLDVFVGGCSVLGGAVVVINPQKPDVPATGTTVQPLTIGANKKVTLPSTPDEDAYSAFLTFTANRAHFSGETCTTPSECQSGQTCTAGVCN